MGYGICDALKQIHSIYNWNDLYDKAISFLRNLHLFQATNQVVFGVPSMLE